MNAERRIQRIRKVIDPPGMARPDWQIICAFAKTMGKGMFTWIYNNTERSVLAVILFHFQGNLSSEFFAFSVETQWCRLALLSTIAVLIVWWGLRKKTNGLVASKITHA